MESHLLATVKEKEALCDRPAETWCLLANDTCHQEVNAEVCWVSKHGIDKSTTEAAGGVLSLALGLEESWRCWWLGGRKTNWVVT